MSKTILGSITKYPDVGDFDKIIFYIENIMLGDYNTISSRNYKFTEATICFPREDPACAPLPRTLPLAINANLAAFV